MSENLEAEWKKNLTSILEDLDKEQFGKLLGILEQIPGRLKDKSREQIPEIVLQCYGVDGSITAIEDAMEQLPRRDSKIQNLLQPFVTILKGKEEEKNGYKRKALDPQSEEETATAEKMMKPDSKPKGQTETGGAVPVRSESAMADQPTTETPELGRRKPIRDLIASNEIGLSDTIGGKIIHKKPLRKSQTQKDFFYLLVKDETAALNLMVYGKPHHREIKEGKYYSFRNLVRDEAGHVKVTSETVVSEIGPFNIPEEVETENIYSIKHFKTLDSGTGSVKGTIIELNFSKSVPVKNQEKKTEKRQTFRIEDDTDSIEVVFWGNETQQCKNVSVGDVIVLNNVKIKRYHNNVLLQSTSTTHIIQVYNIGARSVKIKIVGIIKALTRQTHLEVYLDQKPQTLVVASKLLAEAFGLTMKENLKSQLVDALPLVAEALIEGNRIKKITRSQD